MIPIHPFRQNWIFFALFVSLRSVGCVCVYVLSSQCFTDGQHFVRTSLKDIILHSINTNCWRNFSFYFLVLSSFHASEKNDVHDRALYFHLPSATEQVTFTMKEIETMVRLYTVVAHHSLRFSPFPPSVSREQSFFLLPSPPSSLPLFSALSLPFLLCLLFRFLQTTQITQNHFDPIVFSILCYLHVPRVSPSIVRC